MNKPCKKCGGVKRTRRGECRDCKYQRNKAWRLANANKHRQASREYYRANANKVKQRVNQYRQSNPDKIKRYYLANAGTIKQRMRRYYLANANKVKQRVNQYRQSNPDKYRRYKQRRRALESLCVSIPYDFKSICAHYDNRCLCCGNQFNFEDLTIDHIKPISWGGNDTAGNIQPLCLSCNSSKGNYHATDYRPDNGAPLPRQKPLFDLEKFKRVNK